VEVGAADADVGLVVAGHAAEQQLGPSHRHALLAGDVRLESIL
jgi:hypothetical protein